MRDSLAWEQFLFDSHRVLIDEIFSELSINLSQSSELLFLQYKNNKPMSTNPSVVATVSFFFSLTFSITLKVNTGAFLRNCTHLE